MLFWPLSLLPILVFSCPGTSVAYEKVHDSASDVAIENILILAH